MNAETFAVIGIVIALFSICVAVLTVRRTKTQILEMSDILEDIKNEVPKSDIQIQRATEVYDHYINDLHLNTYIHDNWEKYMKGGN